MRLSTDRKDPDFLPDAWEFDVYVNGVLQSVATNERIVVMADEEAGLVQYRQVKLNKGIVDYVMVGGRPALFSAEGDVRVRRT